MYTNASAISKSTDRKMRHKQAKIDDRALLKRADAWLAKPSPVVSGLLDSLGDEKDILVEAIDASVNTAQDLVEVAEVGTQQQVELEERIQALVSVKKTVSGGAPRDWSRVEWHWVCDAAKKYGQTLNRPAPNKMIRDKRLDKLLVWLCGGFADEYIRSMVGMVEKHLKQRRRLREACASTNSPPVKDKGSKKLKLAQREQSVVLLAEAEGTRLLASLLAQSDQLCRALERHMVWDMPIGDVERARGLFSARGEVAASLAELNAQMEQLLGFAHREIVGDCPGYKPRVDGAHP